MLDIEKLLLSYLLALFHPLLLASEASSAAGLWRTVDDINGQATALVRISESKNKISATIETVINPADRDKRCERCTDDRKNKSIQGLEILRAIPRSPEYLDVWQGGEILDPRTGKTYETRIRLLDNGQALEVKGYIGTPWLGRTQIWQRVE